MKLGLYIPSTTWEDGAGRLGSRLAEVVEAAEAAGFDTIDVADHLWQHPTMGGPEVSQLEVMGHEVIPAVAEL
jgi:alkanesulfonate monooxygenase SsuD/methylene tetrahydromethanopterin reductase-like flavin-dependent oxidoreductase (luciferase family)